MGWDMIMVGTVNLAAEDAKRWMESRPRYPAHFPQAFARSKLELKTVGAVFDELKARATLFGTVQSEDAWSVRAVVDADDCADLGADLVAAFGAVPSVGEFVVCGSITAGEGMAFRFTAGPSVVGNKLTFAEERRLKRHGPIVETERWIEEELACQRRTSRPRTRASVQGPRLQPAVDHAISAVLAIEDKVLDRALRKADLHDSDFKPLSTGKQIKAALRKPDVSLGNFNGLFEVLAKVLSSVQPTEAVALCRVAIDDRDLPVFCWEPCTEVLASTEHGPLLVERLKHRPPEIPADSDIHGFQLRRWADWLGAKTISEEQLFRRLKSSLKSATQRNGEGHVAIIMGAALLARKARRCVPQIIAARFGHRCWHVRVGLGDALLLFPPEVPFEAPSLEALRGAGKMGTISFMREFERRVIDDPKGTYRETVALFRQGALDMASLAPSVLVSIRKDVLRRILVAEPRWKKRIG
jgi:hypothetical protein